MNDTDDDLFAACHQGTLPLGELVQPAGGGTVQERFEEFHAANPHVAQCLATLARRMIAKGRDRIGMKMLFEVLRWEYYLHTDDPNSDYKLNNTMTSRYARLLEETHADLRGVFETRQLRAS